MAGYQQGRASWLDSFPTEDQLAKGLIEDENSVLLVDGDLILQDQDEPIERAKTALAEKGIKAMAYDFFTSQPIKGDDNMTQVPKSTPHVY
ncbi:hypothetical protein IMSHALPRED_004911 [Imshaugia aleurites]|uniref:Uncharacterized protein n=1 Tax=Imshaugia aleurites TaxID=172621 RepID=A0A8H3IIW9_9LECA|nr:hypothetical protein IMSHALPRED_004911 [Imshaugia aleurites]